MAHACWFPGTEKLLSVCKLESDLAGLREKVYLIVAEKLKLRYTLESNLARLREKIRDLVISAEMLKLRCMLEFDLSSSRKKDIDLLMVKIELKLRSMVASDLFSSWEDADLVVLKEELKIKARVEKQQPWKWLQPWYSMVQATLTEAEEMLKDSPPETGTSRLGFRCCETEAATRFWERVAKCLKNVTDLVNGPDLQTLCMDSLPNEKIKSCFLHCVLFPKNFKIPKDSLVEYWISEEFWNDNEKGECNAREEGYHIISVLVDLGLLQDDCKYVKMHDFVHGAVLSVLDGLKGFWVGSGKRLTQAPTTASRGIRKMPLMGNSIRSLAEVAEWSELTTLFFCHNKHLSMISDGFFQFMAALTVLDLSNTSMQEMPKDIPNLVSLQYLNLSNTWIEQLPVEVKKLVKLRCLNLEHNDLLRSIPRQVISSFIRLQVLRMFGCGVSLVVDEDNILSYNNMHVDELQCLERLNVLSNTITSAAALKSFLGAHNLASCTKALSLKCLWGRKSLNLTWLERMEHLEKLEIYLNDHLEELIVDFVMERTETHDTCSKILRGGGFNSLTEVNVGKCCHLRDLTMLVITAPNLIVLKVTDCRELEEIISVKKLGKVLDEANNHLKPFDKLEILLLQELPILRSIYWKTPDFPCLKKVRIFNCPMLNKIPFNTKKNLGHALVLEWEDSE